MAQNITLTIDEQSVTVPPGTTILQAARQNAISIPTICFHEATTSNALCRLCVVEVEGSRVLVPSCVGKASQGMVVKTHTERVMRSRRTILEMLSSTVDLSEAPEIQAYLDEYQAEPDRFPEAQKREAEVQDDNPMYVRDYTKCILCWRCVQVCAEDAQYTFAINFRGRGFETEITTFFDKPMPETSCVFCGQCVGVCPTGALKPKREWLLENGSSPDEIMALTRSERRRRLQKDSGSAPDIRRVP
jgi:NADH dehydrogenase/NADH:ubiquinone oxidoreductase subunit G